MLISELPTGSAPEALKNPVFPAPHLAVVWHNWNLVHPARIAGVLGTTEAEVEAAGNAMGLVRDDSSLELFADRGYMTVIRTNWHLLDYEQLLDLIGWTPEKLAFTLKEDDFFWVKLGWLKPKCGHVEWRSLSREEDARVAEIARETKKILASLPAEREPPFEFLKKYGSTERIVSSAPAEGLRMIYSYSAVYGDPFLDEKTDPYPENLLKDYAAAGVNAVWLPGLLYTLVPWLGEELGISKDWEKRLAGVRKLSDRCAKYGIRLFLYLNEPRCLPVAAAAKTPFGGAVSKNDGTAALCPNAPGLCETLSAGIERLCREVPTLGGFFTITMSENLTHCLSRNTDVPCPRCAEHTPAENVSKVLGAIHDGIVKAGTGARLIAWSWAWDAKWAGEVLRTLPADIDVMCVSETNVETLCRGVKGTVIDYSISKPGPGPDAKFLWDLAAKTGHRCVAKVQVNTTWEMSSVPFIPVPFLVERHLNALRKAGVRDFMLSWTLGGSPGGNLPLLEMDVRTMAEKEFGSDASAVLEIWKEFSEAFAKLPFHYVNQIYLSPQNIGPANLLYPEPTGYHATMVRGFPYDDLAGWRGIYPEDVFEDSFREISEAWGKALAKLEKLPSAPALTEQKIIAETVYCCLRSTYLQTKFIRMRNAGRLGETAPLVEEDSALALRQLRAFVSDSRIGFEACNDYFYTVNEMMEKILSCSLLLKRLQQA